MPYLSVKLRQPGDAAFLQRDGVQKVVQTFPDEDPVLQTLYLLLINPAAQEQLLLDLRAMPEIEFAEPVASRAIRRTKA
jgi:hypothetical protein